MMNNYVLSYYLAVAHIYIQALEIHRECGLWSDKCGLPRELIEPLASAMRSKQKCSFSNHHLEKHIYYSAESCVASIW
jgi:hypothetical protein